MTYAHINWDSEKCWNNHLSQDSSLGTREREPPEAFLEKFLLCPTFSSNAINKSTLQSTTLFTIQSDRPQSLDRFAPLILEGASILAKVLDRIVSIFSPISRCSHWRWTHQSFSPMQILFGRGFRKIISFDENSIFLKFHRMNKIHSPYFHTSVLFGWGIMGE